MDKLFFDLKATHNPHRWYLPVQPGICVGPPGNAFMFGGAGLASAVAAVERTTGRPLIWATAQYLSYARPPSIVDLDVWIPAAGKYNTQARVTGHVDDKEILTVNAAVGARPSELSGQWTQRPDVPPPEDCDPVERRRSPEGGLHSRIEVRLAPVRSGTTAGDGAEQANGRTALWVRSREGFCVDSAMLAIYADLVPSGIAGALGRNAGGNSLDNTLRIRRIVPTDWVLCDIQILGVHGGFGHGAMSLYSQDGELMATASQSLIVRVREGPEGL